MISPKAKSHFLLGALVLLLVVTIVAVVPDFLHSFVFFLLSPLAVILVPALFLGACFLMRSILGCLGWPRGRAWGGALMSVGVLAVLVAVDVGMSPPRSETLNHAPGSGDGLVTRVFRWALLHDQPDAESLRAFDEAQTAYAAEIALEARVAGRIAGRILVNGTVTNHGNKVVHRVEARIEIVDADRRHVGSWIVRVADSLIDVPGADPMPLGPGESREFRLDLRLSDLTHSQGPPPAEPFTLISSIAAVQIEGRPQAH